MKLSRRKYNQKNINEARIAYESGMSMIEIAKAMDIPYSTIRRWNAYGWNKKPADKVVTPEVSGLRELNSEQVPLRTDSKMTLKDFVSMLREFIDEFDNVEKKLLNLQKDVDAWKKTAGLLNEQINKMR